MSFKRADYDHMAWLRKRAFQEISATLGKGHALTKMMGSLAWGRHDAEQGPNGSLHTAIREYAFLEGYFRCMVLWARDHDPKAQRIMLDIWPRGMTRSTESVVPPTKDTSHDD